MAAQGEVPWRAMCRRVPPGGKGCWTLRELNKLFPTQQEKHPLMGRRDQKPDRSPKHKLAERESGQQSGKEKLQRRRGGNQGHREERGPNGREQISGYLGRGRITRATKKLLGVTNMLIINEWRCLPVHAGVKTYQTTLSGLKK